MSFNSNPWVSTQVNSASGQINVALFSTYLHKEPSIKRRPHCPNLPVGVSRMPTSAIFEKKNKLLHCQFVDKFGKKSRWEIHETMWWAAHNILFMTSNHQYLAHVIEQPNFRISNPQYLQRNFCFDFFNDSENTFWGFFEI